MSAAGAVMMAIAADRQTGAAPTLWGLTASGGLVAMAVAISAWRRLGVERAVLWAATRAALQLAAIGAALTLVVSPDAPLVWSWVWVLAMVFFAAVTVRRRSPEVPAAFVMGLLAFSATTLTSLAVLFGFGIFAVSPRTVVPLAGMVVGNSLSSVVLAARRTIGELRDHRDEVESRLALGLTARAAAQPQLRAAIRDALVPQVETTKSVGLVFLPGAMVGLILAGVEPADAVRVQLAVMYLILGSVAVTTTVMVLGVSTRLFTPDQRLAELPRAE
ncbi:MAG: iron export ABC transporter permease subunit FetB [Microthrixaceae bacterium]